MPSATARDFQRVARLLGFVLTPETEIPLTRISHKNYSTLTFLRESEAIAITSCQAGAQHAAPLQVLTDMRTSSVPAAHPGPVAICCEKCGLTGCGRKEIGRAH